MTTKNLLVAVDFSEASNLVVDKARELAQELSARIVLLHVMEPKAVPVPKRDSKGAIGAAWPLQTPKRLSGIKARLNSLAKPLKVLGIEVESIAVAGLLLDEILDQAGKYRADYIILGSHGHPAARHLATGNLTTGILSRLACPLIIVPAKAGASQ
ncbi:MAG: universal stress protein [Terrimicrobiaceae bacterium]